MMMKMTRKEAMMYDVKEFFTDPYNVGLVLGSTVVVAAAVVLIFAISCLV